MELSNKKGVQTIVAALAELGLSEIVMCPGSRNAPFVISFNRHPQFNCISIRDERAAGFIALGKIIETGKPVAILCTSGSAALNFAPAIAEAYYQRLPLIVITADRPREWIGQGNGQAIQQSDVYQNYIRKSYDLDGDATDEMQLWYNSRCVSEAYHIATHSDKGPVHFNVPLQEPLYQIEQVENLSAPTFQEVKVEKRLPKQAVQNFASQLSKHTKVMILVGQMPAENQLVSVLHQLSEFQQVVILSENTSNLSLPSAVEHIDRCITHMSEEGAEYFMPDLLITLGGEIVSKRIKALLRKYPPRAIWNVHEHNAYMDTYMGLTHAIPLSPVIFFEQINEFVKDTDSTYREQWLALRNYKKEQHDKFMQSCLYSDLYAFKEILDRVPVDTHLHVANSSAVRYSQLFDNSHLASIWSNRGVSGIDGSSSTAVGAALASPEKDFLLISGDVAFHYDINALWNEAHLRNLKIIVINNSGGGIFRIIDGPNSVDECQQYFETAMDYNLENLAKHHQWQYLKADNSEELINQLEVFFNKENKRVILEVFTNAHINPEVLNEYWNFLKNK